MLLLFVLNMAFAREVPITEVDHSVYGCASQLTGMACDDPKRLAKMGPVRAVEFGE